MKLVAGKQTDKGRVREGNEDGFVASDRIGLFAVADGMGGHQGGDVASAIACEALGRSFADQTVDGLIEAIEQANQAVYETATGDPELTGMGTTMVALAVVDEEGDEVLAVANVGDSRSIATRSGHSNNSPRTTAWWRTWCAEAPCRRRRRRFIRSATSSPGRSA
jgi:serine/threonine protein phosphatase PrpC